LQLAWENLYDLEHPAIFTALRENTFARNFLNMPFLF